MSSARQLVFKPLYPGKAWTGGNERFTLIIRREGSGFLCFLQKWSISASSYELDPILPENSRSTDRSFQTMTEAEDACQRRYEQEQRWTHRSIQN